MFLAWVEVRADSSSTNIDRQPAAAEPSKTARCGLVEKEFPELRAARAWAARQLSRRPDVTGNVAVFETNGPLVSLAWRRDRSTTTPLRARRRRTMQPAE